jgi:signal transduction histidine kinase/CheY-like chemotaxis protein
LESHALEAFMPHGMCYLWRPDILLLHVASDGLIALAYFSIPAALLTFLRRRRDLKYPQIFRLFIAFILLCGLTHMLSIVTVWQPIYVVEGIVKLATAAVSMLTAIVLWPLIPKALAIPSPSDLAARNAEVERLNRELQTRIDSLGTLAGGVSHDFNNLLTVILGNAELLQRTEVDEAQRDALGAIEESAERASALCRQMLAYSGRGHFMLTTGDLDATIEAALADDETRADLAVELAGDLPRIDAAPAQLHELVRELIANAREATADLPPPHGPVRIVTRTETVDAATLASAEFEHDLVPGEVVVLEIADAGPGLTADVRRRMFEPYFSTRFTGRGLGLAAVQGIVRGHRAALIIETPASGGTVVRVLFSPSETTGDTFRPLRRGGPRRRRILVLDDEPGLLRLAAEYLERLGYEAITTTDPDEAIDTLLTEGAGIEAVILDYLMPHRTGPEVLAEIRTFSQIDVYLTSGFARGELQDPELLEELAGFIPKPFRHEDFEAIFGEGAADERPSTGS